MQACKRDQKLGCSICLIAQQPSSCLLIRVLEQTRATPYHTIYDSERSPAIHFSKDAGIKQNSRIGEESSQKKRTNMRVGPR